MTQLTRLPLTISEAAFQRTVIDYAIVRQWRVSHALPARTARGWATATQGHVGAPDLLLARDGVTLHVELKSQRGRLTPEQRKWAAELGASYRCWRPSDWPAIVGELA